MRRAAVLAAPVALALAAAAAVLAQLAGYELSWNRIAGGGLTTTTGGTDELGGTAGQTEAGLLSGGSFTLSGGFWGGAGALAGQTRVYVPLAVKAAAP